MLPLGLYFESQLVLATCRWQFLISQAKHVVKVGKIPRYISQHSNPVISYIAWIWAHIKFNFCYVNISQRRRASVLFFVFCSTGSFRPTQTLYHIRRSTAGLQPNFACLCSCYNTILNRESQQRSLRQFNHFFTRNFSNEINYLTFNARNLEILFLSIQVP